MRDLDLSRLRRTSLHSRKSKVSLRGFASPVRKGMSFGEFLAGLPDYLAARDFRAVVDAVVRARRRGAPVLLGIGAHFIKVGLSPLLLQGLSERIFDGVADPSGWPGRRPGSSTRHWRPAWGRAWVSGRLSGRPSRHHALPAGIAPSLPGRGNGGFR